MDKTVDVVLGIALWIGAWQLAVLLTENLPKKQQIIIFAVITILALVLIFRANCQNSDNDADDNNQNSSF